MTHDEDKTKSTHITFLATVFLLGVSLITPNISAANPLAVPYIRQCGDTSDTFDGRWACGATSAVMIAGYYNRLPADPIWCTFCKPDHSSDYGKYVSEMYTLYGYTFDRSHPTRIGIAYGAYGHIHDYKNGDPGYAWAYRVVDYFRRHGLFAQFDNAPTEAEVRSEIDKGHPVWASTGMWPAGHIVVMKGYTNTQYYVADPWPYDGTYANYCDDGSNMLYTWDQMGTGSRFIVTTDPIAPGDRVMVLYDDVYVRQQPRRNATNYGFVGPAGTPGTILHDNTYGRCFHNCDDGYTWWKIEWESGKTGWSACGQPWSETNWIEKVAGTADTSPPIVDAFSVDPESVTIGNSFTISYTVSDMGDSGLNRAELWRATDDDSDGEPDWPNDYIDVNHLSGQTSHSGSFYDTPSSADTYWYGLHVVDNAGNWNDEKNSNTGGSPGIYGPVMVTVAPLSPPTGVSASDGTYTNKVYITWDNVSGASEYRVYRATSSGGTKTALGSWQTTTSYDDYSATPGTTYYYWVKAKNSEGESGYSSYNAGWRKLSAPTGVQASDGIHTDKVQITWNSVSGASHYRVYRATSAGGTKSVVSSWQSSTSYDDYSASAGSTYYYWTKAATSSSGSRSSEHSSYDTGYRQLAVPSIGKDKTSIDFGSTSTSETFQVWNDGIGTLSYEVSVTSGGSYFNVTPPSGTSTGSADQKTHTVTVNRNNITPGQTVYGEIAISSSDADDSPQYISLSASRPVQPSIAKDRSSIDFSIASTSETFSVWNDDTGTLSYNVVISEGSNYFNVSPKSSSSTGSSDKTTHTVTVNRSNISPGQTVTGRVKISSSDADDGPQYIELSATSTEAIFSVDVDVAAEGVQNSKSIAEQNVGDLIVIEIWAQNVTHLSGFNATVVFDASKLECQSANEGPFLKSVGGSTTFIPEINNVTGETDIMGVVLGATTTNSPDGSGVVAEIEFKILKQQGSIINVTMPTFFEETASGPEAYVPQTMSGKLISLIGDFCGANFGPPDGYVDVWDLMQFADHWHTRTGDANWDSNYDLTGPSFGDLDGYVDVWDLMVFADHWHEGQKP